MQSVEALTQHIQDEHQRGRLVLPSLPEVVLRVRDAVNNEAVSLKQIVKLIQLDPSLTARLIQIANSPLYRTEQPVEDCLMAINRLGLATTRDLVTCLVLHNVFDQQNKQLHLHIQRLWRHSCHVAAISSVIAKITPRLHEDKALLGGLLHDIGVLPVLHYAAGFPHILASESLLNAAIQRLRGTLGQQILQAWNFDQALHNVPLEAENWQRDTGQAPDYADIVIVAQIHAAFGTARQRELPPLLQTAVFNKLGLSKMGPDASLEVLYAAEHDIRMLVSMLN